MLTLSATGGECPARIICQCARHHPALLANGALCSRSLPMGSPNPSPADGFAKQVSRTVLTSGGPQKCVAVMARREVVRKEGFCEQRAAQGTGTDIRLQPNQPSRWRDRPVWDRISGMSEMERNGPVSFRAQKRDGDRATWDWELARAAFARACLAPNKRVRGRGCS